MSTVKFVASSSPATLATIRPHVTVEAEYGDECVTGSVLTMAHHGPRAGGKCPASYVPADVSLRFIGAVVDHNGNEWAVDNTPSETVVGLSHFDLDTLGGCLAVLGDKPGSAAFWRLAEFVDVNGPHRLADAPDFDNVEAREALYAFWAWSSANRGPRVTAEVVDLTAHVHAAAAVIAALFPPNPGVGGGYEPGSPDEAAAHAAWDRRDALVATGRDFMAAEEALRASSLVASYGPVCLRQAEGFVNHLYLPLPGAAVVGFNSKFGTVTVSFADGADSPYSAVEIVQALWGSLAGGHKGIAGSPRDRKMTLADAEAAFSAVIGLVCR